MRHLFILSLSLMAFSSFGQLTIPEAKKMAAKHGFKSCSYHTQFEGHKGYGAPIVITADGGSIFFGGGVNIVKLDKSGLLQWKTFMRPLHDEIETQSVVQDSEGNYYAFVLSYNYLKHRGGAERVLYLDKQGNILWDKTLGDYSKTESPHCSYIRALSDGRLELRGHIVPKALGDGMEEDYHFWTGWLDRTGKLTQEVGKVLNWSDPSWKEFMGVQK